MTEWQPAGTERISGHAPDLRSIVEQHYAFVWRVLRWLGVPEGELDDVAQEVFVTASCRLADIEPGCERGFVFGVALRKAAAARRAQKVRGATADIDDLQVQDLRASPEQSLQAGQARAILDRVIASIPHDLRIVFVLFELEELEIPEIARMLQLPAGTVGSRLRRAREAFSRQAARERARLSFPRKEP